MEKTNKMTTGKVSGIIANLVYVEVDGPVQQNEICYIDLEGTKLMAEVIKVLGTKAYVQVFESTRGLKMHNKVEFTGHLLEVTLGPGILSKNYDGLQNDLDKMEGVFLQRGEQTNPLEDDKKWEFKPLAKEGDILEAGGWLGEVTANWMPHKIMVPFKFKGKYTVKSVTKEGKYTIKDVIAVVTDEEGKEIELTMTQKWPVKLAIKAYKEKPRPFKLLETGVRVIDTLNPIAEGGTGFIPGPFGTGKTVLQHALSPQAAIIIISASACLESACCNTVFPVPKGPGINPVPPSAIGFNVSITRTPVSSSLKGRGFSLYALMANLTGHFCVMVNSISLPSSSVTTAITSLMVYFPSLVTLFTVYFPLNLKGTIILCGIQFAVTSPSQPPA